MNISIICIGRLKERYWADAANEYMKRLGAYCEPAVIELRESRIHGRSEYRPMLYPASSKSAR